MPGAIGDVRGFSLIESLVAVSVLTVALSGVLSLFVLATNANLASRRTGLATVLASAKLEQLRRMPSIVSSSPSNTLTNDTAGYCDFLDRAGAPVAGCGTLPQQGPYVRRWSIEPLGSGPGNTVALRVLVTWNPQAASTFSERLPDGVVLSSLTIRGHR